MEYTGLGPIEVLVIVLPLLICAAVVATFFVILYFVVRAAVAAGIRRAREADVSAPPGA
ncbi:hypothetical protein [Brachybacterium sp. UNK5269]|uniref:hypothetical protein n=1 Tax=Brachybacterium sp. UNK5269 TaxID=3408576 RepID=UPI003BAE642B